MTPAEVDLAAAGAARRLVGQARFANRNFTTLGLSGAQIGDLFARLAAARAAAGLSPRDFSRMRGAALRAFGSVHGFSLVELALAHAVHANLWALRRCQRLSARVARELARRSLQ